MIAISPKGRALLKIPSDPAAAIFSNYRLNANHPLSNKQRTSE